MAIFAITSEYVSLGGTDLSAYGTKATLTVEANKLETTNFASGGWESSIAGIKKATLDLEFNDDFAASAVDQTIWNALGSTLAFEVRPTSAARSVTNPGFTGNILVIKHTMGGGVGELAKKSLSLPVTGAVARQTS